MFNFFNRFIVVSMITIVFLTSVKANELPSFESPEHVIMGNKIKLKFSTNSPGEIAVLLKLPNGLHLTYGEILSLGDFYQIPNEVISQGRDDADRSVLFLTAFGSLARNKAALIEATQIIAAFYKQKRIIEKRMRAGEDPEEIYKQTYNEFSRQYNCITGGGCAEENWWLFPGRYLQLATTNYDHFGHDAWIAYQTGHRLALKEATFAHRSLNLQQLHTAYAMNAFASHFLTDHFAAGHMRTPRKELANSISPSLIGSLLSSYMHNEENHFGLHVHNLAGDYWIAYGDKLYLDERNKVNRHILQLALQYSADEIFQAFVTGEYQEDAFVYNLLPIPDENNNQAKVDISPLFYWDQENLKLYRRVDLANYYDKNWTIDWWGWSTLLELRKQRGLPGPSEALFVCATSL